VREAFLVRRASRVFSHTDPADLVGDLASHPV